MPYDKSHIELVAEHLSVAESLVEKDWYVVQVLATIAKLDFPDFKMVFSGGTALSKAHRLIQRFSEDIDFRVIAKNSPPNKTELSKFKHDLVAALNAAGYQTGEVIARDSNRFFRFNIIYQTQFDANSALRPHIQVEVAINSPQMESAYLPVYSFVADIMKQPPEVEKVACMIPVENAADKLSAITWRVCDRVRGGEYDDPTIVRHIHDLAILKPIAEQSPEFVELVKNSMSRDNNRVKNNMSFSNLSLADKFSQMLDILQTDIEYKKEYDLFVRGVSYAPTDSVPSYNDAVKAVEKMIQQVTAT